MIRPPGLVGLAALAGWLLVAPATVVAADPVADLADGASSDDAEIGDGPELDDESFEDLVADAQRILTLRGYDAGPIDGQFGLRTQRAIRAYQNLARDQGYLEALKGPQRVPSSDADGRRELVRMDEPAPLRTR
jgi:peptidoglycan hydrolase-like protein with peptidoglycan-binding domain